MRNIFLFLLFVLMMLVACQPQKTTVETQQSSNEQTKQPSGEQTSAENLVKSGKDKFTVKDFDGAIEDFTKAIETDPKHTVAYSNRGTTYLYKRDFDKAFEDFNKSIELDPANPVSYLNRGTAFMNREEAFNRQDIDKAIADFTKATELDPNYYKAYKFRAAAYRKADKQDLAETDERKAIMLALKSNESGQKFENDCYSFDLTGLKANGRDSGVRYRCESAFILNNPGHFPTLLVQAYGDSSFNLAEAVRKKVAELEKQEYKIKHYPIKVAGASAERLDITYSRPKNQVVIQDGKQVSEGKAYLIFVDTKGKLSDSANNRKISGFTLDGNLNQPEQEIILQRVLDSWTWK